MSQSDSGNSFDGRIWVRQADRERVNDMKTGDETQADVLERVLDFYEDHDPETADADEHPETPDTDALADAVAERVTGKSLNPDVLADALAERIDTGSADPAQIAKQTADEVERRLR
jgi:hypothetical protein